MACSSPPRLNRQQYACLLMCPGLRSDALLGMAGAPASAAPSQLSLSSNVQELQHSLVHAGVRLQLKEAQAKKYKDAVRALKVCVCWGAWGRGSEGRTK